MFGSVQLYPLATVVSVTNCAPLIAYIVGVVCLKERNSRGVVLSLIFTFVGASLLVAGGGTDSMIPE